MNRKLSLPTFILTQILVLLLSLAFLGGLYYILNIQYQLPKSKLLQGGPVTSALTSLVLELDQDDNILVFQPSLIVSGSTSSASDVLITTANQDIVVEPKINGSFSTVINLSAGVNEIRVFAFDKTGDQRSQTRTVFYSKEKL